MGASVAVFADQCSRIVYHLYAYTEKSELLNAHKCLLILLWFSRSGCVISAFSFNLHVPKCDLPLESWNVWLGLYFTCCSSWQSCTWHGKACGFYIWRNFFLNRWVLWFTSSGAWNLWFCVLWPTSWAGLELYTFIPMIHIPFCHMESLSHLCWCGFEFSLGSCY